MARPQNRKRPHADGLSRDDRPAKKIKSRTEPSNFPPQFWDDLSKVWLTPRALRELDRRNSILPSPKPKPPEIYPTKLGRFARHGGPDLRHLRGYSDPAMASRSSRAPSTQHSKSTKATSVSSKSRRSSAYDDDYEQHLVDHGIFPPFHQYTDGRTQKPKNLSDHRRELAVSRASLSPSRFTESVFEDFQRKHKTKSEITVMRTVIPVIAGSSDIPNEGDLLFTNMESLTGGITVTPKPDFFDGTLVGDVDKDVRDDLSRTIIPTKHAGVPIAPNFFMEAKAPRGGADVAQRQACTDGAYGARAMHALQNYGKETPEYDGNAYAFSSTYHAGTGTLAIYSHHITAPPAEGERPEYHMTQLDSFAVTGKPATYIDGVGALRNTREMAKNFRDKFIREANIRAAAVGLDVISHGDGDIVLKCRTYRKPMLHLCGFSSPRRRVHWDAWPRNSV